MERETGRQTSSEKAGGSLTGSAVRLITAHRDKATGRNYRLTHWGWLQREGVKTGMGGTEHFDTCSYSYRLWSTRLGCQLGRKRQIIKDSIHLLKKLFVHGICLLWVRQKYAIQTAPNKNWYLSVYIYIYNKSLLLNNKSKFSWVSALRQKDP